MSKNTARASPYESIANDPKYRHFIRIPRRIIRCLNFLGVQCDEGAVKRRLRAYYLFIGVVDNAIDSGHTYAGHSVLRQLESTPQRFDVLTHASDITLATDALRLEMCDETHPELLRILGELNDAVEDEQTAGSMTEYIEARKRVGQLTARASYVLIRPLLRTANIDVCRFMERVGEIGCLVDSVIDLDADRLAGLLKFQSTARDFFRLVTYSVKSGVKLSIEYPQLFGLFLEAAADDVLDRFRTRGDSQSQKIARRTVTIDAAPTVWRKLFPNTLS